MLAVKEAWFRNASPLVPQPLTIVKPCLAFRSPEAGVGWGLPLTLVSIFILVSLTCCVTVGKLLKTIVTWLLPLKTALSMVLSR